MPVKTLLSDTASRIERSMLIALSSPNCSRKALTIFSP